jgi:hypothetical protein
VEIQLEADIGWVRASRVTVSEDSGAEVVFIPTHKIDPPYPDETWCRRITAFEKDGKSNGVLLALCPIHRIALELSCGRAHKSKSPKAPSAFS